MADLRMVLSFSGIATFYCQRGPLLDVNQNNWSMSIGPLDRAQAFQRTIKHMLIDWSSIYVVLQGMGGHIEIGLLVAT